MNIEIDTTDDKQMLKLAKAIARQVHTPQVCEHLHKGRPRVCMVESMRAALEEWVEEYEDGASS